MDTECEYIGATDNSPTDLVANSSNQVSSNLRFFLIIKWAQIIGYKFHVGACIQPKSFLDPKASQKKTRVIKFDSEAMEYSDLLIV